jgi:hypothetical protein
LQSARKDPVDDYVTYRSIHTLKDAVMLLLDVATGKQEVASSMRFVTHDQLVAMIRNRSNPVVDFEEKLGFQETLKVRFFDATDPTHSLTNDSSACTNMPEITCDANRTANSSWRTHIRAREKFHGNPGWTEETKRWHRNLSRHLRQSAAGWTTTTTTRPRLCSHPGSSSRFVGLGLFPPPDHRHQQMPIPELTWELSVQQAYPKVSFHAISRRLLTERPSN